MSRSHEILTSHAPFRCLQPDHDLLRSLSKKAIAEMYLHAVDDAWAVINDLADALDKTEQPVSL